MMELDSILSPSELPAYFLAVKYVFAVLFGLWLLVWFRWGAPWILVGGAIFFCLFAWTAMQAPLHRLYSFQPPLDRAFNVAMSATAATGHSPFESYQVGAADLEPFWRAVMSVAALGRPENVLKIYPYLPAVVLILLPLSLYLGLARKEVGDADSGALERRWELALVVYAVMLLNSSVNEQFGVFRSFWPMNFLLKPNHALGFVLIPLWLRAWTGCRPLVRTWGAGVVLGVLAWAFLMHWSYVLLGLLVYPLVARWAGRAPELGRTAMVAGISLLAAFPYVLVLLLNFHWGYGGELARKIWLKPAYAEGYFNIFSVGYEHGVLFFLSLAGIVGMASRRRKEDILWLALLAGSAVGWATYLALFGLKKVIQPDEFYFYSRFLLSVAAGSGAYFLLKWISTEVGRLSPGGIRPKMVGVFLILTLPQSFPYWWNPPQMDRYYHVGLEPIPERISVLGQWIRENASPDAVFVADADTSLWIAALSGRRVLLTGHHRPPFDYAERRDLERRMLVEQEREAFLKAWRRYQVSHLALEPEYLSTLNAEEAKFESLPWLERVYDDGRVEVFAIRWEETELPGGAGTR